MNWSTPIARNYHLSYDHLISELAAFGYEDEEEIENVAEKIINEVDKALPENISWLPSFAELWIWGESVSDLRENTPEFTMDDFKIIYDNAWENSVY